MDEVISPAEPPCFVVCLRNDDWPIDLQVGKAYRLLADASAERSGWIRIIDETGEDYLYPEKYFQTTEVQFALCVCNAGYPAALELHRTYPMLPDAQGERHGLVRIVDESGEAYLYPREFFRPVDPASPQEG